MKLNHGIEWQSSNEIGKLAKLFNEFINLQNNRIEEIRIKAKIITSSSTDLSESVASAMRQIAESVNEITQGSESTAAAVEEIDASTKDVAREAGKVMELSEKAKQKSEETLAAARQGSSIVQEIKDAVQEIEQVWSGSTVTQVAESLTHIVRK